MIQVLAVAHFCKEERLVQTLRELGCKIVLITKAKLQDQPWPRDLLDELFFVHDFRDKRDVLNAVSYLHQDRQFDLVVALDEYAVSTAAVLRAHLGCPGLDEGVTRRVRDKLTMRFTAQSHQIPVPRFCGFNNRRQISELLSSTQPPWMVKPRSAGGSVRIQKLQSEIDVWQVYDELGDRRSYHLIEEFIAGAVYHVDSIVSDGEIVLEVAGHYQTPPFEVWHHGGVFAATTVRRDSALCRQLLALNRQVVQAVGVRDGVNHAEFLGLGQDLFFLEIAARVPGSQLDQLTTASTGIDLFAESAKIQLAQALGEAYKRPQFAYREAALIQCLAQQKWPELGNILALPELCWTLSKDHHAGVAFASADSQRIEDLVQETVGQFQRDYLAVLPATES